MSTYNCFIRKNNKYLRKKLRDLGYLDNTCFTSFDNFLYTLGGDYYTCKSYDKFSNMRSEEFVNECIDCGTNEDLFLAIAALRDDSDYMQWFVSKGWKEGFGNVEDKWVLCDQDTLEYFGAVNNSPNTYNRKKYPEFGWHKATVKELIEHFKTE